MLNYCSGMLMTGGKGVKNSDAYKDFTCYFFWHLKHLFDIIVDLEYFVNYCHIVWDLGTESCLN